MFLYIFVGITKLPMWKLLSVQTYLYLQNMLSLQFCNISILDSHGTIRKHGTFFIDSKHKYERKYMLFLQKHIVLYI
uniref:Uncharacterized protein n=1 Tax=viral metagenome TaxID=1070528 RepID=A0A6C0H2T2_9ZZZZ